jgi:hypothetical protein
LSEQENRLLRIKQPYFFHADAVAIAGQIDAVSDQRHGMRRGLFNRAAAKSTPLSRPLPIDGVSCALAGNGGISENSKSKGKTRNGDQNLVSFDWARARTEGQVVKGTAITRASADLINLQIGECDPLFIANGSSELEASVPLGKGAPSMRLNLHLSAIEVFGGTIHVEFEDFNSGKGMQYLGLKASKGSLLSMSRSARQFHKGKRHDIAAVELVKSITFSKGLKGVKKVLKHGIYVDNIGYIFFGEVIVSANVQRVSLMRFEFGCGCRGGGTGGTLGSNGGG